MKLATTQIWVHDQDEALAFYTEKLGFEVREPADRGELEAILDGAQIVLAAGPAGVELLRRDFWARHPTIELLADYNAAEPLGIEGTEATDDLADHDGKLVLGALAIGGPKMKVHKTCVRRLFESNDQVLDTAVTVGAIPTRFSRLVQEDGTVDLAGYFTIARGEGDDVPAEMTKWFDTNYHYLVPEIGPATPFVLSPGTVLRDVDEAAEAGYRGFELGGPA